MITCVIKYEIDPYKVEAFEEYARRWGQAIPQCGAELIGYFAPHEGSATTAMASTPSRISRLTRPIVRGSRPTRSGRRTMPLLAASSSSGRKSGSSSDSRPARTQSPRCRSQQARMFRQRKRRAT